MFAQAHQAAWGRLKPGKEGDKSVVRAEEVPLRAEIRALPRKEGADVPGGGGTTVWTLCNGAEEWEDEAGAHEGEVLAGKLRAEIRAKMGPPRKKAEANEINDPGATVWTLCSPGTSCPAGVTRPSLHREDSQTLEEDARSARVHAAPGTAAFPGQVIRSPVLSAPDSAPLPNSSRGTLDLSPRKSWRL